MAEQLLTPVARLSFPSLFEARSINGGAPKFQATLLLDKAAQDTDAFKALKRQAKEAAIAKWGADNIPKKLKTPFLTVDDLENVPDGYEDDHVFIRLNNPLRPGVVDSQRNEIIDPSAIYAGCDVLGATHAYAWEHPQGGKGVSFSLDHIMKVADNEPFGNRTRAVDAFAGVDTGDVDDGVADDDDDVFG